MLAATKCLQCGQKFAGKRRTAKYCSPNCRARASEKRKREGTTVPTTPRARKAAAVASKPAATLQAAVEAELSDLGKLNTTLGRQAVELAKLMASGGETGAAVAALSRELRSTMALASRGGETGDPVDELKAKRDEKRAAAAG